MSDPERWVNTRGIPPELRAMLGESRLPSALPRAVRERTRRKIVRLATVPAAAVISWVSVKAAAFAVVGTVGAVSAIVAVEHWVEASRAPEAAPVARPPAAVPARRGDARRENTQHEANTAEPSPAPAPTPSTESPTAPSATNPGAAELRPAPAEERPPSQDSLQHELDLIESARSALASEPVRALALLERHEREFPEGQLSAERALIRIQALRGVGRAAEARALGERLLETAPRGLYRERVERLLREP